MLSYLEYHDIAHIYSRMVVQILVTDSHQMRLNIGNCINLKSDYMSGKIIIIWVFAEVAPLNIMFAREGQCTHNKHKQHIYAWYLYIIVGCSGNVSGKYYHDEGYCNRPYTGVDTWYTLHQTTRVQRNYHIEAWTKWPSFKERHI